MVDPDLICGELNQRIDSHFEWLLARENGRTFPLRKTEIEVTSTGGRVLFGFVDDGGFRVARIRSYETDGNELSLLLGFQFGNTEEVVRLIPRTSAKELGKAVELARLEKANETARIIVEGLPKTTIKRVALNAENGRLAQITVETVSGDRAVALSDLTEAMTPEALLTTAVSTLRDMQRRLKKPPAEAWLICEKKRARNLQKLCGLLNDKAKRRYKVFEISRKEGAEKLAEFKSLRISDLWREKTKKIDLPAAFELSETAERIVAISPDEIDVIFSKQGETLRFLGLPFARVRRMLGTERAWFGTERERRPLTEENWQEFLGFVEELKLQRRPEPETKRHEFYRTSPESWLESTLKRNIRLLDANLILSPLYNQFRTSADKIDLLAIRKDGRLVIIELKTSPDREMVFQGADYWRKIELQRRRGELDTAFAGIKILDKPALVYAVAPALSFHSDFETFARMLAKDIEIWRFELHENWRADLKVLARRDYPPGGAFTNL
jgi:hypothetical protein